MRLNIITNWSYRKAYFLTFRLLLFISSTYVLRTMLVVFKLRTLSQSAHTFVIFLEVKLLNFCIFILFHVYLLSNLKNQLLCFVTFRDCCDVNYLKHWYDSVYFHLKKSWRTHVPSSLMKIMIIQPPCFRNLMLRGLLSPSFSIELFTWTPYIIVWKTGCWSNLTLSNTRIINYFPNIELKSSLKKINDVPN